MEDKQDLQIAACGTGGNNRYFMNLMFRGTPFPEAEFQLGQLSLMFHHLERDIWIPSIVREQYVRPGVIQAGQEPDRAFDLVRAQLTHWMTGKQVTYVSDPVPVEHNMMELKMFYPEMGEHFGFERALQHLKAGRKASRSTYDGYVVLMPGYPGGVPANEITAKVHGVDVGHHLIVEPYFVLTQLGHVYPWMPCTEDILAGDWYTLPE